jgi:hypothetical protein
MSSTVTKPSDRSLPCAWRRTNPVTPVALIRTILRDAGVNGVGQYPNAEDNNDMFVHLNLMLGQWSSQRWLVFHLVDVIATVTGAATYSVGTGGAFNVVRPDRIESAFFRSTTNSTQPVDYSIGLIEAREDWNRITTKSVGTWPQNAFYDSGYPLGTFYPWPIPANGIGELHISVKDVLPSFPDLVTDINLPPAYLNALLWNGVKMARVMYGMRPDPVADGFARAALSVVRNSNTQIGRLMMPIGVPRGRRYNINSDTFR